MPAFQADLHNHTPASADYRQPEASAIDIVRAALDAGLDIYAPTDHFTIGFAAELIAAAEKTALETRRALLVVPGTELRVTHRGDEAHITALFDPAHHGYLFHTLLGILGLTSRPAPHAELPGFTIERDPVDVARIVHTLGGIACVAHADRAFGAYRLVDTGLFARLAEEPAVTAIDLLDPSAPHSTFTGKRNGSIIGCSDSHSCDEIGARRAIVQMDDLSFASLRSALTAGAVRPEVLV